MAPVRNTRLSNRDAAGFGSLCAFAIGASGIALVAVEMISELARIKTPSFIALTSALIH
jgi:hypothetical protein